MYLDHVLGLRHENECQQSMKQARKITHHPTQPKRVLNFHSILQKSAIFHRLQPKSVSNHLKRFDRQLIKKFRYNPQLSKSKRVPLQRFTSKSHCMSTKIINRCFLDQKYVLSHLVMSLEDC